MKPGIVNIIYFVLGLLLLGSVIQISSLFTQDINNGYSTLYNASLSILVFIGAIASIATLYKKTPSSRWISLIVVGLQSLLTIGVGIYMATLDSANSQALLIPYLTYGIPMLFLAYKIYSSKPLQAYLKNA